MFSRDVAGYVLDFLSQDCDEKDDPLMKISDVSDAHAMIDIFGKGVGSWLAIGFFKAGCKQARSDIVHAIQPFLQKDWNDAESWWWCVRNFQLAHERYNNNNHMDSLCSTTKFILDSARNVAIEILQIVYELSYHDDHWDDVGAYIISSGLITANQLSDKHLDNIIHHDKVEILRAIVARPDLLEEVLRSINGLLYLAIRFGSIGVLDVLGMIELQDMTYFNRLLNSAPHVRSIISPGLARLAAMSEQWETYLADKIDLTSA